MHFHIPPVQSTLDLVEGAPIELVRTGWKVVVEITGYPDGHFNLALSQVEGGPKARSLRQVAVLPFRDADETKDALDLLIDRVGTVAA